MKRNDFILLLIVPLAIFWSFGFYHLDKFETADEHYWTHDPSPGRVAQYWEAIGKRKWADTFINDKPGVTLAYISGPALLVDKNLRKNVFQEFAGYRVYDPEAARKLNFLFRLPLLIFNGLFVLVLAWLVLKITDNRWVALWSGIFMFLSPPLIGISQIINPDTLLWTFVAGTILSWTAFLEKREKKFIFLTGLFFGFSLLTKYTSVILVPFLFAEAFIHLWLYDAGNLEAEVRKILKNYWAVILAGGAIFSLLFPAVIFKPKLFSKSILELGGVKEILLFLVVLSVLLAVDAVWKKSRGLNFFFQKTEAIKKYFPSVLSGLVLVGVLLVLTNWIWDQGFMRGIRLVPFDEGEGEVFTRRLFHEKLLLEFLPIVFSLTPSVLFLWTYSLLSALFEKEKISFLKIMIVFFIVVFFLAVASQGLFITVRYGIILYPLVAILAAMALWDLCSFKIVSRIPKTVIALAVISAGIFSIWQIKPFYFNYTNFLLNRNKMITDAWGYGGWEAGEYLNGLPDAQNLVVWVDYNGYCPFFEGKCIKGKKEFRRSSEKGIEHIDYFLKTRRGSILYPGAWGQIQWEMLPEDSRPVWRLEIGDRKGNYVEIYKAK